MTETLGQRLMRLRKRSGLKQAEVSAEIDLNRTFLSKMESKSVPGTWEKMCRLSDLYNVSLDYLRFGDSVSSSETAFEVIKDPGERALLRAWREMNDDEKRAFALMASRFDAKAV